MTIEELESFVRAEASSGKSVAEIRKIFSDFLKSIPLADSGKFYTNAVLSEWISENDDELRRIIETT